MVYCSGVVEGWALIIMKEKRKDIIKDYKAFLMS